MPDVQRRQRIVGFDCRRVLADHDEARTGQSYSQGGLALRPPWWGASMPMIGAVGRATSSIRPAPSRSPVSNTRRPRADRASTTLRSLSGAVGNQPAGG